MAYLGPYKRGYLFTFENEHTVRVEGTAWTVLVPISHELYHRRFGDASILTVEECHTILDRAREIVDQKSPTKCGDKND